MFHNQLLLGVYNPLFQSPVRHPTFLIETIMSSYRYQSFPDEFERFFDRVIDPIKRNFPAGHEDVLGTGMPHKPK